MRFQSALLSPKTTIACGRVDRKLSAYVDGALSHADRREMAVHLRECHRCSTRYEELSNTRGALKRIPPASPPGELTARLRILALRQASIRRDALHGRGVAALAWEGIKMRTENLMRPLAIPFAGGLVSAMVLLSMLVPSYPVVAARTTANDVPTVLYQEPTVKSMAPFGFSDDEVLVEVIVDDQGQVVDYSLPHGKVNRELRREIENTLLFARFTPALSFGQPTTGRIRLSFRRSRIDVKG
ncbi:MAG TPA: zf-HC2 domain-containing protein [Bryobacteraceae bacterium]|nr:zf-HC2 domain-containing protein [Bryobacteraceae bacterium]